MGKKLFLLDGFGAVLSAFMLGIVLVKFKEFIGLPIKTLYLLSIIPCFFAVYSFACFFLVDKKWRLFLKIIAILNLLYCLITIILLALYYDKIKVLGVIYFVLELIIVGILIAFEFKKINKKSFNTNG